MVPAESMLGGVLGKKSRSGNPYYRYARFRTVRRIEQTLKKCGFRITEAVSTLFHDQKRNVFVDELRQHSSEKAGFVVLVSYST
jgi:hypothetical protein